MVSYSYKYMRALPDGVRRQFDAPPEKPVGERYFDDFLAVRREDAPAEPLEFYFFGKEQSYPERALNRIVDSYILHYVTDGKGTVNGHTVRRGQGFLLCPSEPSFIASDRDDPWHFKWISLGGTDAPWILNTIGLNSKNIFFEFDFEDKIDALADEVLYSPRGDCDINTYLQGIFYIILSYHKPVAEKSGMSAAKNRYVREAVEYIDSHYGEAVKIDFLASELHISRKYLCAVFGKHMGMSAKEYLLLRRTEAAARLLISTDMPVSEIAAAVGYGEYTQLSRLFKEKKGMSPLQYRKMGIRRADEMNFVAPDKAEPPIKNDE